MASGKVISSALSVEKRQKDKEAENKMVEELVEHLKRIAPFNKRWQVIETINQGTYGVVFSVQDVVTKVFGVIKVAKSLANDSGNASAEWEGFILETMFKRVSRSLWSHYFSLIETNEILQTASVEYLQKLSKAFKLIRISLSNFAHFTFVSQKKYFTYFPLFMIEKR
uniref:Protein kinase domain-containing protein n=1 Tax=Parascaris univalens TaxID=6257 RepID=A0A915CFR8_PARUN